MNEQSPVNFFTINGNKGNVPGYNMFDNSTGQITSNNMMEQNIAPSVKAQSLTDELEQQGIKVSSPMAQESKQAFVDSLTTEQYNKMLQYKDAGYTFEASKAMLEQTMGPQGGGYRGEGFQINQPVGGTFLNSLNPVGLFFEKIDDWVQEHVTDFDDGDDEGFSAWTAIKNVPGSLLKTASATARGLTNPLDTIVMLKDLAMTEEGRGILKERYGSWDGILNTLEKDPVGLISDVLAIVDGGASIVGGAAKAGALGAKVAGKGAMASKLTNFGNKASRLGNIAGVSSDLGLSIPYNAGLDAIGGKLSQGGKLARGAGTYLELTQRPLQTIWKGGSVNPEGITPLPGLSKKVGELLNKAKENIQTTATGLTPELKDRIRNNPYVGEYWTKTEEMINSEGAPMDNMKITEQPLQELGEDLARRIEEYQARLEENGPAYRALRSTTKEFDLEGMKTSALGVFNRRDINVNPDGSLRFANMILPTDMNPINTAWILIQNANLSKMTAKDYLNLRKQFDDLAKYESGTTSRGVKVIREMRNQMDKVAKKEIPGLAKIDELYSKQIKDLNEVKKGLVYMQGERKGELRDNFYSILRTLNTQNRQKMKARLENLIYPGIGARVEAIRMLPELAKAYQNSPQMLKAIFKTSGALAGIGSGKGALRTAMGYLVGLVADELLAKPLGEKRRKVAIDKLLSETTPEAQQMLAEVASKMKAGAELTENERISLETAIQEIVNAEDEYLNEQNLARWEKEWSKGRLKNPALPEARYEVGENGPKVNEPKAPREYNLNYENKAKEVLNLEEELNVDRDTATKVSDSIEDFLDEIGANEKGDLNPSEVNYDRFSTESLNELYVSDLPEVEKEKIARVLEERQAEESNTLAEDDKYYAYKIRQLEEEEQRIGKVGKNKVNKEYQDQQKRAHETKKEKVIKEIEQVYNLDANGAYDKYQEFANKPVEYIDSYKKSDRFADEEAERIVLERLMEQWSEQPKFTRNMSSEQLQQRNEFIDNVETKNGYKLETRDTNDRYVKEENGKIVDYGAIYWDDGKVRINAKDINGLLESGVLDHLPADGEIKISGEEMTMTVGEARGEQYQKFGKANPDEKWISADEGLSMRNFKNGKTVQDFMDHYGISRDIVEKIVTDKGERALGKYMDKMIELEKTIKEGTAPHELFHAVFDLVDEGRKERILNMLMERNGWSRRDANEWLADNFSEYFRTGKFDNKEVPKGLKGKIRYFFNMIKDFVRGITREKKQVKQLFDDILDNKIETDIERDMVSEVLYNKNGVPVQPQGGTVGTPSPNSLTIDKTNSSQFKKMFDDVKNDIKSGKVNSDNFLDTIKQIIKYTNKESEYITNTNTDEVHTLRVSDHHAKAWHSLKEGHPDNNTSVVIKLFSNNRGGPRNKRDTFQRNRHVNMKEFAYDTARLTPEKMEGIIDSINNWIDNGEWSDKNYNKFKESVKRDPEAEYQITQESLFDEPKKTAQDYDKIVDDITKEIAVYTLWRNFDQNVHKWLGNLTEGRKSLSTIKWNALDTIQLYQDYKRLEELSKDERLMNYLDMYDENTKQGDLYKMLKQIQDEPVDFSQTLVNGRTPDELDFMKKTMKYDTTDRRRVIEGYDPDILEWYSNISKNTRGKPEMTLKELTELKAAGQKLIDQGIDKIESGFNVAPENMLLEKIKQRTDTGMFEKKSVNKIADKAYDTIRSAIRDIEMMNDDYDIINGDWKEGYEDIAHYLHDYVLQDLADSYDPDVDKWQENFGKMVKKSMSEFEGFKGVKQYKTLVGKPRFADLKSYVERLKDVDPQLIKDYDVQRFIEWIKEKDTKLQAKGANTALRKLVAQSLMTLENFEKQMKNFGGKSPMPSIAVMDKNIPHTWDYDATIDLVFGKDTVDPKADSRNKIYGSDAWTPTFPSTTLKEKPLTIDEGISYAEKLIDKLGAKEIFPHGAIGDWEGLAGSTEGLRDYFAGWIGRKMRTQINRGNTKNLKFNIGQIVREAMMDYYQKSGLPERKWDEKFSYDQVVESVSDIADEMKEKYTGEEVIPASYFSQKQPNYGDIEHVNNVAKQIVEILPEKGIEKLHDEGYIEGGGMNSFEEGIFREFSDAIEGIEDFPNNTPQEAGEGILDLLVDGYGFDKETILPYIEDVFGSLDDEPKDRPYNAQNALEAMLNQRRNSTPEEGSFVDMIKVKGTEVEDIEGVRSKNFSQGGHVALKDSISGLERRYDDLVGLLAEENDWLDGNPVSDGNVIDDLKYTIKNAYDTDVNKFKDNLLTEYPDTPEHETTFNEDVLKRIIDVVERGKTTPVKYTESKPERIVDLYNEVQAVLAPTEDRARVEEIVKGTPLEGKVTYYNNNDMSNPRQRKLEEIQKKNGNIFFQFAGTIMPIAILLQAVNNIQGDNEEVA